ncbi:MAG: efflux RND transporter periplasmic adaptor subunit [Prevotellaceae bacterium]|nr:efflux RND transporter periplasmic adaptor subunit [Prevotellaceae bacterium]
MKISKNIYKKVLWALVLCFVAYTFYFLWAQSQPKPEVYELLTPAKRTIKRVCVATGSIESRKQIEVKPRATGTIKQICVTIGQTVTAGQTIAIIEIIPDMLSLSEAKSNVESTRLEVEESQREANRVSVLYDKGVVGREEYEKAMSTLAIDKEKHIKAKSALDVVLTGSSSRAGNVNTTIVKASMNGTIVSLPLKEGASVVATNSYNQGTTIATIADLSQLRFSGKIDESEVERIYIGMPMNITIGASKGARYTGFIEEIASGSTIDNGTVMYEIKGSVEPVDGVKSISRSGYSANAEIITDCAENVLSVEEVALEFSGDSTYVYRLKENSGSTQTFERVPVTIGLSDGIHIELKSEVKKGDILRGNKKED